MGKKILALSLFLSALQVEASPIKREARQAIRSAESLQDSISRGRAGDRIENLLSDYIESARKVRRLDRNDARCRRIKRNFRNNVQETFRELRSAERRFAVSRPIRYLTLAGKFLRFKNNHRDFRRAVNNCER